MRTTTSPKVPNRTQAAIQQLHDMAREAGAGAKLPTVNELMQQLGISKATLSAALAQLEDARVLQRKHGIGIFVCEKIHHTSIAIIFDPRFFRIKGLSPYWHLVWNALSDVAQSRTVERNDSFSFHLAPLDGTTDAPLAPDLCDAVIAGRIDGVLAVGLSNEASTFLYQHDIPFVTHSGNGSWHVDTDSVDWVRRATRHLIEKGCRELAMLNPGDVVRGSNGSAVGSVQNMHVFLDVLSSHGLIEHIHLIKDGVLSRTFSGQQLSDTHQRQGYEAAMEIFGSDKGIKPDGIIIRDDMMAQGALTAMEKLGVRAGRDIQVVSHANKGSTILQGYEEDITRLEYDPHDIAVAMFEMLDILLRGETPENWQRLVRARWVEGSDTP